MYCIILHQFNNVTLQHILSYHASSQYITSRYMTQHDTFITNNAASSDIFYLYGNADIAGNIAGLVTRPDSDWLVAEKIEAPIIDTEDESE